jgi:superoxide reductase
MEFFRCSHCEQVYIKLIDSNQEMMCCGEKTEQLEKLNHQDEHAIQIRKTGNFVRIKIENHLPMTELHHLKFICIETTHGFHYRKIEDMKYHEIEFMIGLDEEIRETYVYCNIHLLVVISSVK